MKASTGKLISNGSTPLFELKRARYHCAVLIKEIEQGHKLLPIFERLDSEIARLEKQELLLNKAINIANDNFKK